MKKRVLSFVLGGLILASTVVYAADTALNAPKAVKGFNVPVKHQMMERGKAMQGMKHAKGGLQFVKGQNNYELVVEILSKLELTDEQKKKLEAIKSNAEAIKELEEKLAAKMKNKVKVKETVQVKLTDEQKSEIEKIKKELKTLDQKRKELTNKMVSITGKLRNTKVELTEEQKQKFDNIRENMKKEKLSKLPKEQPKKITEEEKTQKLLGEIDNIIAQQEGKIKSLQNILTK